MARNAAQACRDRRRGDQPATLRGMLVSLLRDEELAARIGAEDAIELLGRDFSDVAKALDASVRNDNVEFAEVFDSFSKQVCDLLDVGAICLYSDGLAAGSFNLFDHFCRRSGGRGVCDDDRSTVSREVDCYASTNATARARD
jgi:hypothetical protein